MKRRIIKDTVVIYHRDCSDGFGSAWAAWRVFGDRAIYLPSRPNPDDFDPSVFKNKKIFLTDVSFSGELIEKLLAAGNEVTVIDHHLTTADTMKLANNHSFDLKHSAAVLTWLYLQPKKPVPKLLLYIEDMDLWIFNLPHSKEISALLEVQKKDFKQWNKLAFNFEKAGFRKKFAEQGRSFLVLREEMILEMMTKADEVIFEGYETLAVNAPFWSSEIGSAIYLKKPPIGIVWSQRGNQYFVSLRSNGKADVRLLAEKYGGGGHTKAAGFRWPADKPLPWKNLNQS